MALDTTPRTLQPPPPPPLSKNQIAKREWKAKKKIEQRTDRLSQRFANLEAAQTLQAKLQINHKTRVADSALYHSLPQQTTVELFHPHPDNSLSILSQFISRSSTYNEKYSAQELAIAFQVFKLSSSSSSKQALDVIVDVGAGNANLSCLLALIFDVPVICVEKDSNLLPELQSERRLPSPFHVSRHESLIEDYKLPPTYSNAIVIGKHLCGAGTDAGIDFCSSQRQQILGCVWCTCCCCKITEDYGSKLFEKLHGLDEIGDHESLVASARTTNWRTVNVDEFVEEKNLKEKMVVEAGYSESWIQGFRRRKLSEIFGWCQEVIYCSNELHSQQNRFFFWGGGGGGGRGGGGGGGGGRSEEMEGLRSSFFELLDERIRILEEGGVIPLDLVARNLAEKRVEFDRQIDTVV